jgi:hypothetical protein
VEQQPGAGQQRDRDGDFGDDDHPFGAVGTGARTRASRTRTQCRGKIVFADLHGRQDSEDHAGEQRNDRRHRECRPIDRRGRDERQILRRTPQHLVHRELGDGEADRAPTSERSRSRSSAGE